MIEFGAKLSLKDQMYAVLAKNVQKQKEFQKEVNATREALQKATDGKYNMKVETSAAQKEVEKISNKLEEVSSKTSTAKVGVEADTEKVEQMQEKVDELTRNPVQMRIEANEREARRKIAELKAKLDSLKSKAIAPVIKLKDTASRKLETIKNKTGYIKKLIRTDINNDKR